MMSRDPKNPYATPAGYDDIPPGAVGAGPYDDAPERVSVMAVVSLFCSVPCCVIPGLGIVGIALGAAAMASIRRNAGRLTGRGLAIAGIILGIIVTALQLFFLFGALQGWTFYTKQMAPPAERFFTASDAGDFSLARDELQPAAGAELTDERIAAFIAAAESANGQYQGVSTSFGTMIESFQRVRASGRAGSAPGYAPVPITLTFDSGPTLAWVLFDEQTVGAGPKIGDILLQLPATGQAITLRENGPAATLAPTMGITVAPLEPGAAPPTPERQPEPDPATEEPAPTP